MHIALQIKGFGAQDQLVSLDLRIIEHIIDDDRQRLVRILDRVDL